MTRTERGALIAVIFLIAAGLVMRGFRSGDSGGAIWVESGGAWRPVEIAPGAEPANPGVPTVEQIERIAGIEAGPVGNDVDPSPARSGPGVEGSAAAIDLNRATEVELDRLPGIGPVKARAIVLHRARVGPFETVEDIVAVSGIGPATLERIRPYVVAGGPPAQSRAITPSPQAPTEAPGRVASRAATNATGEQRKININTASAAQLQEITGIGPRLAERIIARRGRRPFRRPEDLIEIRGIGPKSFEKMRPRITVR